jgi:type IV secretion system protein VirB6
MFEGILSAMIGIVGDVVTGAGAVQAYILPPLTVCVTIYLIIYGYSVMRGAVQEPWGSYLATVAKVGILYGLFAGSIGGIAAEGVVDLPETAIGWVGGSSASPGGRIDQFIGDVIVKAGDAVDASDDWSILGFDFKNPVVQMVSIIPIILAYLLGAVITLYVIFLKFALAVTALFGPLFIAAAVFEVTRGAFFTWLGAVLSYAFSIAVLYVVIELIFATLIVAGNAGADAILPASQAAADLLGADATIAANNAKADAAITALLAMSGVMLLGIGFVMQAQSIAQGFTGGGGGSGASIANALLPSAFTARVLASKAGGGIRSAGQGTASTIRGGGIMLGQMGRAGYSGGKSMVNVMRGRK